MNTFSDEQLVVQVKEGDMGALETLVRRYMSSMYSFCYGIVHNQHDAQDMTQEVFLKVWKNIRRFDSEKMFRPWLYRIARNTCLDFLKKKNPIAFSALSIEGEEEWDVVDMSSSPERFVEKGILRTALEGALLQLPSLAAEVVALHVYEGYAFAEIAALNNESLNTVKSRYRRALERLRGLLSDRVY